MNFGVGDCEWFIVPHQCRRHESGYQNLFCRGRQQEKLKTRRQKMRKLAIAIGVSVTMLLAVVWHGRPTR
jgi:hypothetical protein